MAKGILVNSSDGNWTRSNWNHVYQEKSVQLPYSLCWAEVSFRGFSFFSLESLWSFAGVHLRDMGLTVLLLASQQIQEFTADSGSTRSVVLLFCFPFILDGTISLRLWKWTAENFTCLCTPETKYVSCFLVSKKC